MHNQTPRNHDDNPSSVLKSEINQHIHYFILELKKRYWLNTLVKLLPVFILVFYLLLKLIMPLVFTQLYLQLTTVFIILSLVVYLKVHHGKSTKNYLLINSDNFLLHCNRVFSELEESAQLVVKKTNDLSLLRQLQQQKIIKLFHTLLTNVISQRKEKAFQYKTFQNKAFQNRSLNQANNDENNQKYVHQQLVGQYKFSQPVLISAVLLLSLSVFDPIKSFQKATPSLVSDIIQVDAPANKVNNVFINKANVTVTPPINTKLPTVNSSTLDLTLIAGSNVHWQLDFSIASDDYVIELANGERIPFLTTEQGTYVAQTQVEHSGIYKISSQSQQFEQIHSLSVTKDNPAVIRILSPKQTVTEVAKLGVPSVDISVQIRDDFGLSKVEILASIAKGSGEAVKFRDQVFAFDEHIDLDEDEANNLAVNRLYKKQWQFLQLDMEPGDELYFTVKAWDNHYKAPQLTRSITKIIRWLEDEQQIVMADGVLIDFMPEYFKSQRQIIIETMELIADQQQLSREKFVETSELLGVAQSELKQKYGQYLGDEFDDGGLIVDGIELDINEGEGSEHASQDDNSEAEDHDEHDEENHQQAKMSAADGHDHGVAGQSDNASSGQDKSGYQQMLATYAHNHEDSDIGLMGQQDPKALMKRSISFMWQAELHLMLSEPELALPFEQQALKYLKLAKKADRIYVKRLGFEPPPVSEQRRYQGELDEIKSRQNQARVQLENPEQHAMNQLYQWLNAASFSVVTESNATNPAELTEQQSAVVNQVQDYLQTQLQTRSSLIEFIATLEKIKQAKQFQLEDCQDCLIKLKNKIWQVLNVPLAMPSVQNQDYLYNDALIKQFSQHVNTKTTSTLENKIMGKSVELKQ